MPQPTHTSPMFINLNPLAVLIKITCSTISKIRFGTSVRITHHHFVVGSSQNRQFLFIVHYLHKTDILFKVNFSYLVSTSRLFPLLPMTFQSPSLASLALFFSFACLDRISNNCFSSIHCILVRSGETEILFHFSWPFKFSS